MPDWGAWYEESEHPRGQGGRWVSKGGGGIGPGRIRRGWGPGIGPAVGRGLRQGVRRPQIAREPVPSDLEDIKPDIRPGEAMPAQVLYVGVKKPGTNRKTDVEVLVNPTLRETMRFIKDTKRGVRAMRDTAGNVYVWDSEAGLHEDVATSIDMLDWSGESLFAGYESENDEWVEMGGQLWSWGDVDEKRPQRWIKQAQDNAKKAREEDAVPEDEEPAEEEGGTPEEEIYAGKFDPEKWRAMGMQKARTAWAKLSRDQRDIYANARDAVLKRVTDIVGFTKPTLTGDIHKDISNRVDYLSTILPPESSKRINRFITEAHDILTEASDDVEGVGELTLSMLDHVAAQEFEAMGRTLGDHGEHHIEQDEHVALKLLSLLPEHINTPRNRAMMTIAAAYHDSGYLTEPARVFLNVDHPRWGVQYYQENISPLVTRVFGKDFSEMTAQVMASHSDTSIDWENAPEKSCFSVADNLALFQEEKMPPLLREVRGNTKVLVDLGLGRIGIEEAQQKMLTNIKKEKRLTAALRAQAMRAVKEVTGVLPKYTLGMLGTRLGEIEWKDDHPLVTVEQHESNESLCKVVDFGQKQFEKLAETYNHNGEEFIKTGQMVLTSQTTGKTLLEVRLVRGSVVNRRTKAKEPWL